MTGLSEFPRPVSVHVVATAARTPHRRWVHAGELPAMHGGAGGDQSRQPVENLARSPSVEGDPRGTPVGRQRTHCSRLRDSPAGRRKRRCRWARCCRHPLWCGGSQSRTVVRNIDGPGPDQQRRSVLPVGAPRTGSTGHPRRARRDEAARRGAASACDPRRRTPRPINAAQ
jgi:hypothetical protein